MNRKILGLIVFHFYCLATSNAQDSIPINPKHFLGIYTGYSHHIIRDETASPLVYSGGSSPVLLEYEYFKHKTRQVFTFFIGNTKLRSSNTNKLGSNNNYADNLNAFLSYSYSRNANIFKRFDINSHWGFTFLSVFNFISLYINKCWFKKK